LSYIIHIYLYKSPGKAQTLLTLVIYNIHIVGCHEMLQKMVRAREGVQREKEHLPLFAVDRFRGGEIDDQSPQ
jgi:hypothetical protein